MIWQIIEILAEPDLWAITLKNGEAHIESIETLTAKGIPVK